MAAFVFREELEPASLGWQLRRLMRIHSVVNLDVLSLKSGLPENVVRSLLEAMVSAGEVERLRPVGYNKNDMDFFMLCHRPRTTSGAAWQCGRLHNWYRWIDNAKRAIRVPSLGRRQNAYS